MYLIIGEVMRMVPRRLLMTDEEKALFYGTCDPFFRSRYEELRDVVEASRSPGSSFGYDFSKLSDSAFVEWQGYKQQLREIGAREPDYGAIARNMGWELLASTIEAFGSLLGALGGGIHFECDNIRKRKSLPYQTQEQTTTSQAPYSNL